MTEFWVSQGKHWCTYCKCWLNDNKSSILRHEQAPRHKEALAKHLKDVKWKGIQAKRDEDYAQRNMAKIEEAALKAYQKDQAEGRPEHMLGPALPGAAAGPSEASRYQGPQPGVEEPAPAAAASSTAGTESGGVQWQLDPSSGYYFDVASKYYYDSKSTMYYNSETGEWGTAGPPPPPKKRPPPPPPPPPKKPASEGAEGAQPYALGLGGRTKADMPAVPAPEPEPAPAAARAPAARAAPAKAAAKPTQDPQTTRAAYALGYGTMHPAYLEAAAKGPKGQPAKAANNSAKRWREETGKKELSEKEKEEIARREAARARVQARTQGTFGFN